MHVVTPMIHTKRPLISVRWWCVLLALASIVSNAQATQFESDGWHTWRVEATSDAAQWCCAVWRNNVATHKTCELDERNYSYGNFNSAHKSATQTPKTMQIYTLIEDGQAKSIRTLSSSCSVKANTEIIDHGTRANDESTAWLLKQVNPRNDLSNDALAAISIHRGQTAENFLRKTATNNKDIETRKESIFWIAQSRARQMAEDIKQLLTDDPLPAIREHAIFSLSQTDLEDRAKVISVSGLSDRSPEVRGKAWFWLAQTEDSSAGNSILGAISREKDPHVVEEAIFALSQLPEPQATESLMTVVENKRLNQSLRKRAIFWLAQSESDEAINYLSKILSQ